MTDDPDIPFEKNPEALFPEVIEKSHMSFNRSSYTIASQFYITPARNALARLPRELLASGQACEAGGRLHRFKKEIPVLLSCSTEFVTHYLFCQIKEALCPYGSGIIQ